MARTEQGATLTAQHRRAQLALRARALRDFVLVWPLWEGDERSFARLIAASVPLVRAHHRISAALAATYYQSFRAAEQVGGSPAPRLVDTLDAERVATSLHVTGQVMTRKAIAAGHSPQSAMQVALVRTSGAIARHVLAGGRDTLVESARADRRANGYGRIVAAGGCSFCQKLAAKGLTDEDFQAHDHCGCTVEPAFS